MNKSLLVPIDFEQPTLNAMHFALDMAEDCGYAIDVLHLIRSESDRTKATLLLNDFVTKQTVGRNCTVETHIMVGKVESDIDQVGQTLHSSFIVMGIHESSSINRIFGSRAIDVISESKTPFIVVQGANKPIGGRKIAMTIDLEKESIQVVKAAIRLAKEFKSEIVLVGGDHTDPDLKSKVAVNVNTARRVLADNGIQSHVVLLDRKHFLDHFIDFCREENVDIIAATYYADTFSVFSTKFVQKLLENEAQIPVLTMDHEIIGHGSQYSFMSV